MPPMTESSLPLTTYTSGRPSARADEWSTVKTRRMATAEILAALAGRKRPKQDNSMSFRERH